MNSQKRSLPDFILDNLLQNKTIQDLFERIDQSSSVYSSSIVLKGLFGSSSAFLARLLAGKTNKRVFYVAKSTRAAEEILADLEVIDTKRKPLYFPAWSRRSELKNGESTPIPAPEETESRISCLASLISGIRNENTFPVTVCSSDSFFGPTIPKVEFENRILELGNKLVISPDKLIDELALSGYERVGMVQEIGDFSVRGGILDLFSPGENNPVRIEFLGDEIESLRIFEPETQRSIREVERITALPAGEMIADAANRISGAPPVEYLEDWEKFRHSGYFEGAERLFHILYPKKSTILDYLKPGDIVIKEDEDEERAHDTWTIPEENTLIRIVPSFRMQGEDTSLRDNGTKAVLNLDFSPPPLVPGLMSELVTALRKLNEAKVQTFVFCGSYSQLRRYKNTIDESGAHCILGEQELGKGFVSMETGIAVLTDREIFSKRNLRRRGRKYRGGQYLMNPHTLEPGDFIIHIDHGIGIFFGLRRLLLDGSHTDCLEIRYRNDDKLFVPVHQLGLVQKYRSGESTKPIRIDMLGSKAWSRLKDKTKAALKEITSNLIELYATRSSIKGFSFSSDTPWQADLEASFIYRETPDQVKVLETAKAAMEAAEPMDHLVCGDVGFGKTEIALRCAFKSAAEGKQVAILVPTTVLAQQHYSTFRERLAPFPVKVEMLSRFKTQKEQKKIIADLSDGVVDIVIGTHRIVQKDVSFKDLGLLVIDEEQRFGVRHKEKIKEIKKNIDVLSLTATPIPRTMHMALSGIRNLSVMTTPPENRLPIKTVVAEFSEKVIRDAVMREIERGGQIFFVHNRVRSIGSMERFLKEILPDVTIRVAHGQMRERELESVMFSFMNRECDLLLATMIIESGLDIPNANTLIVHRADTFGLAQLYQLRGRIGRAGSQAYAHLLVPQRKKLSGKARHRLRVIRDYTDLGSGYAIAMHDLEIRGAGNVLGTEQHGFIAAVGFDTYCKLLDEAVKELSGVQEEPSVETEIAIQGDAFFPETYIEDSGERMAMYRRIHAASDLNSVKLLHEELGDRFGQPPKEVEALLNARIIRMLASSRAIEKVYIRDNRLVLTFSFGYHPDSRSLGAILNRFPEVSFKGGNPFGISVNIQETEDVFSFAQSFIERIPRKTGIADNTCDLSHGV